MLRILASGELDFTLNAGEAEATSLPASFLRELQEGFARSDAAGLLLLATTEGNQPLPDDLRYWRNFVHLWLHTVCLQPRDQETAWNGGPPADSVRLEELVDQAPLASGMEYLQAAHLKSLWGQLNAELTRRIKRADGDIAGVINRLQPAWRLVGRVTLHLGENKNNHEFPFAFLATYSPRLNARGEVQYLPLAQALRECAASGDRELLRNLLTPIHTATERSPLLKSLLESKKLFQVLPWTPAQAFGFLESIPVLEECGLMVKVPDWWTNRRPSKPKIQVTIQNGPKGKAPLSETLLKFQLSAALDDQTLSPEELEKLLQSDAPLVSLKGQWVEVDAERLRQALEFWNKVEAAHEKGVPFHQGMRWLAGLQGGTGRKAAAEEEKSAPASVWVQVTASEDFQKLLYQIREPSGLPDVDEPIPGLLATLRPYQKIGVAWMDFIGRLGLGACLADDMGLGKTIQVLALLLRRRHARSADEHPRPHLLVVPASLIGNWQREVEKFTPSLRILVAHRSAQKSGGMEAIFDGAHKALQGETLVITTYHTLARLPGLLSTPWDTAVLDEAQAIKNADTLLARTVKQINARVRIALSGTPVENTLSDLWSLFDFLNPGLLGSAGDFATLAKRLGEEGGGFAPLRRLIRPYILRRMKIDPNIAPELPAKTEMTAFCGLTKKQAGLYQRAINQLARDLGEIEDKLQRAGIVLGALMRLKQICNHPSLWSGDAGFLAEDSGKFTRLTEIAETILARQEKALVFTQFREMTQPLADHLAALSGRPSLVLHGGTAIGKWAELVEKFQHPSGPPFFVISLKAGGTGLNLTAASHVIHFDRWWNPAVEDQATDRAFRIGQKRAVLVHKFVCQGTLEERIDRLIQDKRALADKMLGEADGAVKMLTEMSDEALLEWIQLDLTGL